MAGGIRKSVVSGSHDAHAFDYYRCSPVAELTEIMEVLHHELAAVYGELEKGNRPPVRHYADGASFSDRHNNVLVSVLWGGRNCRPNVIASGPSADVVAAIIRANWEHGPSRVDACIDLDAPGLFETLLADTPGFARKWGIRRQIIADDDPDKGDTIYLGSRTSQAFVRIYQPGLKRAQEEGRVGADIHQSERDAVRLEVEFKPQNGRAKKRAASCTPAECWTISRWTADLATTVLAMDVKPISIAMRRESDRERALRFMCQQYRSHLAGLLAEQGGDLEAFAMELLVRADLVTGTGKLS